MRSRRVVRFWALMIAGACCLAAQSRKPEDLAPGKILVTARGLPDPAFAESVILLVQHSDTGALGLMINRRTDVPIARALWDVQGATKHSDPVFAGGPVQLNTVFALARGRRGFEGATQVVGDIHLIQTRPALEKALRGKQDTGGLRIYIGYCGWGPGQLENEVAHNAWYIFSGSEDLVFDAEPSTLWSRLIAKAEAQLAQIGYF